jgi:hypothetical protein
VSARIEKPSAAPFYGFSLSFHFGRMGVSVADGWLRSKLNFIASVLMSSWTFDEEESQE